MMGTLKMTDTSTTFRGLLSLSRDPDFTAATGEVIQNLPLDIELRDFILRVKEHFSLTNQFIFLLFPSEFAVEYDVSSNEMYSPQFSHPSVYELAHHGIHPVRVHNSPIRIRPDFPLYHKPPPPKTHIVLRIRKGLEKAFAFDLSKTAADLHKAIQEAFHVPKQDRFFVASDGFTMEGSAQLTAYKIHAGSIVEITFPTVYYGAQGLAANIPIESDTLVAQFSQSTAAPDWRVCQPGINVDGQCRNKHCACYKQTVVYPYGYGVLDYLHVQPRCPICTETFEPDRPLFLNCVWHCSFVKQKGQYQELPKELSTNIRLFDDIPLKKVKASLLHFTAQPAASRISALPGIVSKPRYCFVCQKDLSESKYVVFKCQHGAHSECFDAWRQKQTSCPLCTSELSIIFNAR